MTSVDQPQKTGSLVSPAAAPSAQAPAARWPTIALLDTAAASTNLGDQIIMEAVRQELAEVFAEPMVFTVTTHDWMGRQSRSLVRRSDLAIAGGTNLLSSRMWFRCMWKVTPLDAFLGGNVVTMGVGWYQYQHAPDPYSRWLIRRLLSPTAIHSVRESYALKMLASIGITSAVNTGCPTLWSLSPEYCATLPKTKAGAVLTALNSYPKLNNPAADRRMIETLRRHYDEIYLWIQTHTDYEYALSLDSNLHFVAPSVQALDEILTSDLDLDYVGVRLHAGIRAIQKGRRAIIVEIDNRAREMGRDFGLPTVERSDHERLEAMIKGPLEIAVTPPRKEIDLWKGQFRRGSA